MRYRIFDARRGLLTADKEIEAESPIEAVRMFYSNVRRITERDTRNGFRGDIVVNNTYVYEGVLKDKGKMKYRQDKEDFIYSVGADIELIDLANYVARRTIDTQELLAKIAAVRTKLVQLENAVKTEQ